MKLDNNNEKNTADTAEQTPKKFSKKAVISLIMCAVLIFGIVGFDLYSSNNETAGTFIAMGTVINTKLYGKNGNYINENIKAEIDTTESRLLSWRMSSSEVSRINKDGRSVTVSNETAQIILDCINYSSDSDGVFDITVGNITKLWDFGGNNQRLPKENEIRSYLPYVDYKKINVSGNNVSIGENQSLDFGAVGKGVACDRVKEYLESTKIKSAVISVGGSLLIYGNKEFNIGIAKSDDDQQSLGTLKLNNTFVSTSGDYEKTFTENGKTYHHILDARTGYPAESELSSVTVICQSGLQSDALSTICYILGYEKSLPILEKYGAEAVFVFHDKTVRLTDGANDIFEITDDSYMVSE